MSALLKLIFPSHCLHCEGMIRGEAPLFCDDCVPLLSPIDPLERCPFCFGVKEGEGPCGKCRGKRQHLHRTAAVFDYAGPAATLVQRLKYGGLPYLAKDLGAYLVAQHCRLEWPLPDLIVPVPISTTRWLSRGYNQSLLLAKSMGEILGIPVEDVLVRRSGDFSQAALRREERVELPKERFRLKLKHDIRDKTILLVDDVLTTGTTLQRCGEILQGGAPSEIYGLTVCCPIA